MEDYPTNMAIIKLLAFGVISWTMLFSSTRRMSLKTFTRSQHSPVCFNPSNRSSNINFLHCTRLEQPGFSIGLKVFSPAVCFQYDEEKVNVDTCTIPHVTRNIVGIGAGLVYQRGGSEMMAVLWLTEISSPFLHLRDLLSKSCAIKAQTSIWLFNLFCHFLSCFLIALIRLNDFSSRACSKANITINFAILVTIPLLKL